MKSLKIIYIHGFNSCGNATKSQLLRVAVAKNLPHVTYDSPTLIHHPIKAMQYLQAILDPFAKTHRFCFVGSSLGGFYAMYLAHRYLDSTAVLINPAIRPWETMDEYCGDYVNPATGEKFSVTPEFVASLENFKGDKIIHPDRFLLLLQTDDEVIDYRIAQHAFADSPQLIRTGGGHQFSDFQEVLAEIVQFIQQGTRDAI